MNTHTPPAYTPVFPQNPCITQNRKPAGKKHCTGLDKRLCERSGEPSLRAPFPRQAYPVPDTILFRNRQPAEHGAPFWNQCASRFLPLTSPVSLMNSSFTLRNGKQRKCSSEPYCVSRPFHHFPVSLTSFSSNPFYSHCPAIRQDHLFPLYRKTADFARPAPTVVPFARLFLYRSATSFHSTTT